MKSRKESTSDNTTIGGRIKTCMQLKKLTNKRLAEAMEVDIETIKAWLENKEKPDYYMLEKLSGRFDIPYDDHWLETGVHSVNMAR